MDWKQTQQQWIKYPKLDDALAEQMVTMSEDECIEAFTGRLSFGTAGMRGILGPGTNRMNIYTVRQATEGLARLIEAENAQEQGVAIAYDSRHNSDLFAREAASVLGTHGIKVYLYESLRPTPVLSFAVRYYHTYAGIMITASHNPAAYNGFKVYGADGGQFPPEAASRLTQFVEEIENPLEVAVTSYDELVDKGIIEIVAEEVDKAYLQAMQTVTIDAALNERMGHNVNIVFTPLHGTGLYMGMEALNQAGFTQIKVVESQAEPDGDFPTVASPNPESREAFDEALIVGQEVQADILLATDPDADRLGAMIRTAQGDYQLLTGNQIAVIMIDYILNALQAGGTLPANGAIVKSIVSTDLANRIAASYDIETVEVLTGFKFIAEEIQRYEETGERTFLMGFEESYGYLVKPFVRDKDAIQALVVLAELTAHHKEQGRTLGEALEDIYRKHGTYIEETLSISYPGLGGAQRMAEIMANIRANAPQAIADIPVACREDYQTRTLTYANGEEEPLTLPVSNAIKARLEDGSWVAFRPSGTEPKIKLYIGAVADDYQAAVDKVERIKADLEQFV